MTDNPPHPAPPPAPPPPRPRRWLVWLCGLVILLSGGVLGAGLTVIFFRHQDLVRLHFPQTRIARRVTAGLDRQLKLTPAQKKRIEPIIRQHLDYMHQLYTRFQPDMTRQLTLLKERVSRELNPRQKAIWLKRFARIEKQINRRAARKHPHRGAKKQPNRTKKKHFPPTGKKHLHGTGEKTRRPR